MEMSLGERIRKARKGNMTQAELAERVGVHEGTIRRWELGERIPDIIDLQKISQVLGVSINELLDGTTEPIKQTIQQAETNLAYWGGVADNARRAVKSGQNLGLIYSLLSDAVSTVKAAMA